jgi:tetratricopeptide (TPR) repeat protein
MRERFGRKLRVYVDAAYERGASDFYETNIKPALLSSHYLLVVATPDAVLRADTAHDWIQREITDFCSGPNARNVIAVRAAGAFDGALPGDLAQRFPNIEIVDLRRAGPFWFLHPIRAARLSSEKLKIIAPLLAIPDGEMPILRQEEERLQQSRLGAVFGATLGVLIAVSALSVFALQSRNRAVRALEDSMFATGSMVILSKGIEVTAGDDNARLKRLIMNQGCDLIDKLSEGSGRTPQIEELVTCRLERAKARESQNELADARNDYDQAISLASGKYSQTSRADAGEALIEARQAFADYLIRQKDSSAAEGQYGRIVADARRFGADHDANPAFPLAEGRALQSVAELDAGRGDSLRAGESYEKAAAAIDKAIGLGAENKSESVVWLAELWRGAGDQFSHLGDASRAVGGYRNSLRALGRLPASESTPEVSQTEAVTLVEISDLEQRRGDSEAAGKARSEAIIKIDEVLSDSSVSPDLKQKATSLKQFLENQANSNRR